jgi:NADH-quinone oxidoreductase subunit C
VTSSVDDITLRLRTRLGEDVSVTESFGVWCADVPATRWVEALTAARDDLGCAFFDWLSAVDELENGFSVIAHVWSVPQRFGLLVRTLVPRADPRIPTATGVYAGASWHEREAAEMFGLIIEGHPHPEPLLLPEGFEGHPLRKEFVLAARAAKAWPGAKEPGESSEPGHAPRTGPPGRRKVTAPGVPDPSWGPRPDTAPVDQSEPDPRTDSA